MMKTRGNNLYQTPSEKAKSAPNLWDGLAFVIILGVLASLTWVAARMDAPFNIGDPITITLKPSALPVYVAHTVFRMFIAFFCSLLFTFIIAPLAAKSRQAEKFLLPAIDILQSIPILGVLSLTVIFFIQLFPNRLIGPECAAIFAIFTSQVWNITLSFYQSLKTVPNEFYEISKVFHLTAWQKFWRIEVPHAIPGLLWNSMISMSAGWFFLVAAEAITVNNQEILLPGIGSYISVAIQQADIHAILYAILAMLITILLYDQLLFRPLLSWSGRFMPGELEETTPVTTRSWFYILLAKTRWVKRLENVMDRFLDIFLYSPYLRLPAVKTTTSSSFNFFVVWCWNLTLFLAVCFSVILTWNFISATVSFNEVMHVFYLGALTALKVAILIVFSSLIWVPVGVWIGLHPRASHFFQPLVQFLAAFPVNLIYPLAVTAILHFSLNVEIWTTPLMILGTQWYILFNVIAGTTSIPKDLRLAAKNFGLKRWLWWKKLALPAIFPYYVTGSMSAAAGCWNASIVSEVLEWGNHKLVATGLGSYITQYSTIGDFPRLTLGIVVMCLYVLLINYFCWRKLYWFSATRFSME